MSSATVRIDGEELTEEQVDARMAELKAKLAEMQEAKQKFVSQHATKTEGELPLGGPTPHVDDSSVLSAKHVIIGHKLGSGFFGDVYQGEWRGIAVALKFLSIDGAEELARESATLDARRCRSCRSNSRR